MMKKLTKVGNSLALVIDWPILEQLNLDDQALPALSRRLRCGSMPANADHRHPTGAARCRRARSPG